MNCNLCMDTGDYPIMNSLGKEMYVIDCPQCKNRHSVGAALDVGVFAELVQAARPFATSNPHKSEDGNSEVLIGVTVAQIRLLKAALAKLGQTP